MTSDSNTATPAEIRTWAQENGLTVGSRGSLPKTVVAAFTEATGRTQAVPAS